MAQDIVMVIGLGNPGADYENTRHNAGALFVEALARDAGQTLRPERKYHGLYARIHWQGLDLHLLNPTTFMNRSGLAIKALADFFRIGLKVGRIYEEVENLGVDGLEAAESKCLNGILFHPGTGKCTNKKCNGVKHDTEGLLSNENRQRVFLNLLDSA